VIARLHAEAAARPSLECIDHQRQRRAWDRHSE
jgi:hypothetical protein